MPPILIDSRDFLKLGFIAVLLVTVIFAAGYLLGHQRAASFYQAGSELHALSLPQPIVTTEKINGRQLSAVIVAGENIDVDRPESIKNTQNKSADSLLSAVVSDPSLDADGVPETVAVQTTTQVVKVADNTAPSSQSESQIVSAFTSDELGKIKYSIQVGMFGRLLNAEKKMQRLQAQQYSAYVSDFTNKNNEVRYNVRFGYFMDKKTAITALKKFKISQQSDGYLVNFSAENIVKVADAIDAVDETVLPAKSKQGIRPQLVPAMTDENKISRVDVINQFSVTAQLVTVY